jgi:hypothetical protein
VKPALLRRGTNVLAAEVHRAGDRDDLRFDAELSGNDVTPARLNVAIVSPPNGALIQVKDNVQIRAEALDGRGAVPAISISIDGTPAGTINKNENSVTFVAGRLGLHHIRAVVLTADGARAEAVSAFNVVENTPPAVVLTTPRDGSEFRSGEGVPVAATASDRGGAVANVEFWVNEADSFASRPERMAVATEPPYTATLKNLPPGHYMVWAVAVDNRKLGSQSIPVHIMVH